MAGITFRSSFSVTFGNSSIPECVRNALNPKTPFSINPSSSFSLPGTTPPQNPQWAFSFVPIAIGGKSGKKLNEERNFSSKAFEVVVTGVEFNGMSTNVVMPPAIAALVAVSKPSQSVLPGSLICTCGSVTPGISTLLPTSITGKSPVGNSGSTSVMIPFLISTAAFFIPAGVMVRSLIMAVSNISVLLFSHE